MSVWVLHQQLTPEEEPRIEERTHLMLPFDGLPDLSMLQNAAECRHLIKALHPEEPPEVITRRVDSVWKCCAGLQLEDIIVVPLPACRELALAEVTGKYQYKVTENGMDMHLIPITWYPRIASFSLRKHQDIFSAGNEPMFEIMNAEARTAIRDRLPHSYNRFAKWKWLLALFLAMGALRMIMGLMTGK